MVHIRSTGGHCHRSLLPGLRCTDEPNVHLHHRREHHASSVSHQLSWDNRQQPSSVGSHHRYRRTARHCSNSISTIRQRFNFSPFFPQGLLPIGVSAALIFWSYLGYENVSNVAEEFKNPERDFQRSIVLSVTLIGVLYLSVAVVTVGTRAYEAGGSVDTFAAIIYNEVGTYAAVGTAILAAIIIFGTVNAYTTGMSRVIYMAAKQGAFPKALSRVHSETGVPHRALGLISGLSLVSLVLFYFLDVDLPTALLIPSGAAILVYVIGSASGIKLFRKDKKTTLFPWVSLGISLIMLPFVGILLVVSLAVAAAGLFYQRKSSVRQESNSNN